MIRYTADHTSRNVERHTADGTWFYLLADRSRRLVDHSPTGFGWGYGGSGPAQLALALLLDVTDDDDLSLRHYQQFKWDVISKLENGWEITDEEITLWLKEHKIKEARKQLSEED